MWDACQERIFRVVQFAHCTVKLDQRLKFSNFYGASSKAEQDQFMIVWVSRSERDVLFIFEEIRAQELLIGSFI